MNAVNLIPMSRRQAKERRRLIRLWTRAAMVTALICAAVFVLCQTSLMPGIAAAESVRSIPEKLKRATQGNSESKKVLGELNLALADAEKTLRANRSVVEKPDWSLLLMMLARTQAEQVVLKRCRLWPATDDAAQPPGQVGVAPPVGGAQAKKPAKPAAEAAPAPRQPMYVMQLQGLGRSPTDVSDFVVRLEETGLFDKVTLVQAAREPFLSGEATGFELQCLMGRNKGGAR